MKNYYEPKRTGKYYYCARLRVYMYLRSLGFKEKFIKPDKNNPSYYCWVFEKNPKLNMALELYFNG